MYKIQKSTSKCLPTFCKSLFDKPRFCLLNQLKDNNKFQGLSTFINNPQADGFTGDLRKINSKLCTI